MPLDFFTNDKNILLGDLMFNFGLKKIVNKLLHFLMKSFNLH